MQKVTFGATVQGESWDVQKDDGSGAYSGPHWQDSPKRRYPYLYQQAATMKIVNAQWKIGKPVAGATYKVKGTGPGQIAIPPTAATLVGTDVIEINNVAAINAFQADLVQFYDTFNIKWEVSVNDGPYQNAESSNNPIYVCLKGPNANGLPTPYRTVVHVACASAGATDADEATANTWGRLSAGGMGPANLMGWDEAAQAWARPLYYYKPGTTLNGNGLNSTAALLQNPNSTGQCTAWTFLFYDAIRLNKVLHGVPWLEGGI